MYSISFVSRHQLPATPRCGTYKQFTMRYCFFFILLLLFWPVLNTPCAAGSRYFTQTVDQPFSGSQSPDDAYISAMTKAKLDVLEQAGTYLESLSIVENAILTRDEVTALAGGIMRTEVIKRENYATEKSFGIVLTTRIEVDDSVLQERLTNLLADRALLRKYNELQTREQELLARIQMLEAENQKLAPQPGTPLPAHNSFAEITTALTAGQWIEKALALWHNGQFSDAEQAIASLNRALVLDDHNPATFNSRAVAFMTQGKYREAEDDLNQALALNSGFSDAYNNLGGIYYRLNRYRDAIAAYSKALETEPDFVDAILNRGMAYRKLFMFEKAFEDFHRVMALQPSALDHKTHAGILVELNDLTELCTKAATACSMNLCRALDFLQARGFCQDNTGLPLSPKPPSNRS